MPNFHQFVNCFMLDNQHLASSLSHYFHDHYKNRLQEAILLE